MQHAPKKDTKSTARLPKNQQAHIIIKDRFASTGEQAKQLADHMKALEAEGIQPLVCFGKMVVVEPPFMQSLTQEMLAHWPEKKPESMFVNMFAPDVTAMHNFTEILREKA